MHKDKKKMAITNVRYVFWFMCRVIAIGREILWLEIEIAIIEMNVYYIIYLLIKRSDELTKEFNVIKLQM